MPDFNKPTVQQELHVNPYEKAVKDHEPTAGDYYASPSPHFNTREIIRLKKKILKDGKYACWEFETILGPNDDRTVSEESLKNHYRPLLGDFQKISKYAFMVVDGHTDQMAAALMPKKDTTPADTQELMASGSREQVTSLLDESERMQNTLEEIQLTAKIIIENKKAELEKRLDQMEEFLSEMNKKVENLVKIITVLNLYTGKNVDIQQVTDGEGADPGEPLSLRQRILYMDEELCAELDHEADYNDIPTFIESLRDPAFLSVIAPEPRCIVAVKPKHHEMGYRSGDPYYDAARDAWNRHTYLVFRNGDKVYVLNSEDLELWDYAFPHSDFEEKFQQRMADPAQSFKDSLQKKHESERYRTTKYMVFLQGIVDSSPDILGPFKTAPNIMKHQGIHLVRDDENLIGTGRKPWREFRDEKNKLIRRGTRILYDGGKRLSDGRAHWNAGGEFPKYYAYEASMPMTPGSGIYHADSYECVVRYNHGKPVTEAAGYLVFRYLPGDTVWKRGYYGYDEANRKNKVAWKYDNNHVLNYDAVTVDELQGYLSDRTLREDFRDMMPLLKKTLLEKRKEERDEVDFKALLASETKKSSGKDCPTEVIDEAVAWWKQKVIFTRPLRSDDAKAFRMIKRKITENLKINR